MLLESVNLTRNHNEFLIIAISCLVRKKNHVLSRKCVRLEVNLGCNPIRNDPGVSEKV